MSNLESFDETLQSPDCSSVRWNEWVEQLEHILTTKDLEALETTDNDFKKRDKKRFAWLSSTMGPKTYSL